MKENKGDLGMQGLCKRRKEMEKEIALFCKKICEIIKVANFMFKKIIDRKIAKFMYKKIEKGGLAQCV